MRQLLLSAAIGLSLLQASSQGVLNLNTLQLDTQGSYTAPVRTVTPTTEGIIVTYTFTDIKVDDSAEYPGQYVLSQNKFGVSHTLGTPAIPAGQDILPAGYDNGATLTLLNAEYVDVTYDVAPAAGDVICETDPRPTAPMNDYDGFYPAEAVSLTDVFEFRPDEYAATVAVCPVQYDYHNKTARIYKTISYKLECYLDGTSRTEDMLLADIVTAPASGPKKAVVLPWNPQPLYSTASYLIVTTPKFHDVAEQFANWKRTLGYNTTVLYSDGETWESYEDVKQATDNFYRFNIDLTCLLIIGGGDDVPGKEVDGVRYLLTKLVDSLTPPTKFLTKSTDLYFCNLSDASIPSVFCGRIPVDNPMDAQMVIDKIMRYESTSPSRVSSFFNTGLYISYVTKDIGETHIKASELVRENGIRFGHTGIRNYFRDVSSFDPNNPLQWMIIAPTDNKLDTLMDVDDILKNDDFYEHVDNTTPPTASQIAHSSINSNINNGGSYVFYSGHGGINSLVNPNYTVCHVDALANNDLQPVIFAPTCLAGRYNFTRDEINDTQELQRCFATVILKHNNGGCVGIFTDTDEILTDGGEVVAYSYSNSICPTNFLNSKLKKLAEKPVLRLGEILNRAQFELYNYNSRLNQIIKISDIESLHLFGDPSMRMYGESPQAITNVKASITTNGSAKVLNVTSDNGTEYILWNQDTGRVVKYKDAISNRTLSDGNYKLCITGENRLPYVANLSDIVESETYTGSITNVIKRGSSLYVSHDISQANNPIISSIGVYVYDNQGNFIGSNSATNMQYTVVPVGNRPTTTYIVILKINGKTVDTKQVLA